LTACRYFDAATHFVFAKEDGVRVGASDLLVIGVMMEDTSATDNAFLSKFAFDGNTNTAASAFNPLTEFFPANKEHYRSGSAVYTH
jgi:hypothetical protein